MRSLEWDRKDLIAEIRRDLWRYLTPAATIEAEALQAAALLQLRTDELRVIGRIQFLTSDELGAFLRQLPFLVRRLATTTASEEEWSAERIRGAIQWARTIGVRQATGIPHLYVTTPARRAYQTPENELLALVLDATVSLGKRTGWHRSESAAVGKLISKRVSEAERWLQLRPLLEVERRPLTATKLARIRSGRYRSRYKAVLGAYDNYHLLAERLDRDAIRRSVETHGLVAADDATLFELVCAFRVIEALHQLGWQLGHLGLFEGALRMTGRKGSEELELHYQSTPAALRSRSAYRSLLQAHEIPPSALRPDLIVKHASKTHVAWLLIEAKGGRRPIADSARAAALDLFAYRTAFAHALDGQVGLFGLGVAWGADLAPRPSGGVMLCSQDAIPSALERFFSTRHF
jgi:hypothetical protein